MQADEVTIRAGWAGRHCILTITGANWLCAPVVDIRIDPDDPATSVVKRTYRFPPAPFHKWDPDIAEYFRIRDDVPLGTPVTIIKYCGAGGPNGEVLARAQTIVGGLETPENSPSNRQ
jgi:hypothetical protein